MLGTPDEVMPVSGTCSDTYKVSTFIELEFRNAEVWRSDASFLTELIV